MVLCVSALSQNIDPLDNFVQPFPNPVTQRILSMIKEWKIALADMSRHKDDLVHIKDMYRLLRFKGNLKRLLPGI
jgi:hypothetical protein